MSDSKFNEELVKVLSVVDGEVVISDEVVKDHLKSAYDVELDDVKKMQDVINNVANDFVGAAGKIAVDHMAANKEVVSVGGLFKVGKQSTKFTVKRTHDVRVSPKDPSQGTRTVHGYVEASTSSGVSPTSRRNIRKEVSGYAEVKLK